MFNATKFEIMVKNIYHSIDSLYPKSEQVKLKIQFLRAMLTQHEGLFDEVISQAIHKRSVAEKTAFLVIFRDWKESSDSRLNRDMMLPLQEGLAQEEVGVLLQLLMDTFQSIPEESRDGFSLSMKDKQLLRVSLLEKTDKDKQAYIQEQLTDLSYDPPALAFRPAIGDPRYVKTNISMENYLSSIIKGDVDTSEFIVLTIGLLQSRAGTEKAFLQKLSADYFFVDYESCLKEIKDYFLSLSKETSVIPSDKAKYLTIVKHAERLRKVDHQSNNTRRIFETRLAQYINGLTHSQQTLPLAVVNPKEGIYVDMYDDELLRRDTLDSVNKILKYFLGIEHGRVDNPLEVEKKIIIFCNSYKDKVKFSDEDRKYFEKIRGLSHSYQGRDREARVTSTGIKERKHETSAEHVGEDVWNSAGGLMTGVAATFHDAHHQPPIRNMLVDASQVAQKEEGAHQWFWKNNRERSAYVGSSSGHTCNIVGMLTKYMEKYRDDPILNRDINFFLVQLVAVYAKRGYHGTLEVIDVLHDEDVKKIFKSYNVDVDLRSYFAKNPECRAFLEYAMNDASAYAQVMVNNYRIKSGVQFINTRLNGSLFSDRSGKAYPVLLQLHDVPMKKASGPRVALAIRRIEEEHGKFIALKVAKQFLSWSKLKNKKYNLMDVVELVNELGIKIEKAKLQSKPKPESRSSLTFLDNPNLNKKLNKIYPTLLANYGVRQEKATGPRVAAALMIIKEKHGEVIALKIADQFLQWSAEKHKNFNLKEVKKLVKDLGAVSGQLNEESEADRHGKK